jgi:hypothetical protein
VLAVTDRPICFRCGLEHDPDLSSVLILGIEPLAGPDQPGLGVSGIDLYEAVLLTLSRTQISPLMRVLHTRWSQRSGVCCCQVKDVDAELDYLYGIREQDPSVAPEGPRDPSSADQIPSDSKDFFIY